MRHIPDCLRTEYAAAGRQANHPVGEEDMAQSEHVLPFIPRVEARTTAVNQTSRNNASNSER